MRATHEFDMQQQQQQQHDQLQTSPTHYSEFPVQTSASEQVSQSRILLNCDCNGTQQTAGPFRPSIMLVIFDQLAQALFVKSGHVA